MPHLTPKKITGRLLMSCVASVISRPCHVNLPASAARHHRRLSGRRNEELGAAHGRAAGKRDYKLRDISMWQPARYWLAADAAAAAVRGSARGRRMPCCVISLSTSRYSASSCQHMLARRRRGMPSSSKRPMSGVLKSAEINKPVIIRPRPIKRNQEAKYLRLWPG